MNREKIFAVLKHETLSLKTSMAQHHDRELDYILDALFDFFISVFDKEKQEADEMIFVVQYVFGCVRAEINKTTQFGLIGHLQKVRGEYQEDIVNKFIQRGFDRGILTYKKLQKSVEAWERHQQPTMDFVGGGVEPLED